MKVENQIKAAQKQIKAFRRMRLNNGLSFMINSDSLPSNQSYLEFSNGSIVIAEANQSKTDFKIIKKLDGFAISKLRKELKLT